MPRYKPLAELAKHAFECMYPNSRWDDQPWSLRKNWMMFVMEMPSIALPKERRPPTKD